MHHQFAKLNDASNIEYRYSMILAISCRVVVIGLGFMSMLALSRYFSCTASQSACHMFFADDKVQYWHLFYFKQNVM